MKKKITLHQIAVLLSFIILFSCSNSENDINNVNSSDYLWYFSGEINGEPFVYGQKSDLSSLDYTVSTSNTLPSTCAYSIDNGYKFNAGIYPNSDESLPTLDIEFIRMHLCSSDLSVKEAFNDLFPIKEYEFAKNDDDENVNAGKVGMYYNPRVNGDDYYTTYHENASENYFEVTKSTANNLYFGDQIYTAGQTLEGNFSIKLYNVDDITDVVEITNGKFKMEFSY